MKFVPHNYQSYCIRRIITDPYLALFLDMGLGKTAITLTAVNDLKYNRFAVSRVLVIAPKRVAETTWNREAEKWDHLKHLRISGVLGSRTKRIKAVNTPADIYIINRENVPWLVEYYRNDWPFDMVIIDESSSFKNRQSQRFKAMKLVRGRIKRLVELTGTPAPNTLIDLWAQIYLLDGGQRLGKTISGFREKYFNPDKRSSTQIFTYKPKEDAQNAIQAAISDICVSMKAEDYLDLPKLITVDVPVVLDAKSLKKYKQLEHDMLLELDDETIDAGSAAVLSNKLLQLCNGAIYTEEHEVIEIHDCKLNAFIECIEGL
ncbi:MAG: SNF2-related protein, partial [Candidatus Ornithomonoglobus sp.]